MKQNLYNSLSDVKIEVDYPKKLLLCHIEAGSRFIQSYFFCVVSFRHNTEIFLKNQLIYSESFDYRLLLINRETLLQNYRAIKNNNDYQRINSIFIDDSIDKQILIISFYLALLKYLIKLALSMNNIKVISRK